MLGNLTTSLVKFIYSEKATKFCKIFTLLLFYVVQVKSKVKISQNIVAFSEYMNFTNATHFLSHGSGEKSNLHDGIMAKAPFSTLREKFREYETKRRNSS